MAEGALISAIGLRLILDQVPADIELCVNTLGNLAMFGSSGVYFGYIDITNETIETYKHEN